MTTHHWYIPSPGQADAAARAAALGLPLADTSKAADYGISSPPAAVCDHDGYVVVTPEPTTFSEVWAAHDQIGSTTGRLMIDVNEEGNLLTITARYRDGETVKSGTVFLV